MRSSTDTRMRPGFARIPVGVSPFAVDFSPDGSHAYVAASGSSTLIAIDCRSGQVVGRARTGRRPWLARLTPDGKQRASSQSRGLHAGDF